MVTWLVKRVPRQQSFLYASIVVDIIDNILYLKSLGNIAVGRAIKVFKFVGQIKYFLHGSSRGDDSIIPGS